MDLFEQTIQYKTLETLESFMELSRTRQQVICKDKTLLNNHHIFMECTMTRFGFGRQSGQTTAIIEYMKKNPNKNIIYVGFSNAFIEEVCKRNWL